MARNCSRRFLRSIFPFDEVHLVAAGGQFHAEFGRDNPAAAIRGIAGNTDVHFTSVAKPICPWRFSSGEATSPPPNTRVTRASVSISGDGQRLAVGASGEDSAGPLGDNSASEAGAVYLFRRTANTWSQAFEA